MTPTTRPAAGLDGAPSRRALLATTGGLALSALLAPRGLRAQTAGGASKGAAAAKGGAAAGAKGAAASAPAVGEAFTPVLGQSGKDVIWIPTPDALVTRMLRLAQVKPQDRVVDLGSGDGKIVIAAALEGAQALGLEYNADMVALSRVRAAQAGVSERARFERADIFESDFSQASVITMYLLPRLNLRLRPRILALKPGTRIVSHQFSMGQWRPDEVSRVGSATTYLWLVPANAGGEWRLEFTQASGAASVTLRLRQRFQRVRGTVHFRDFIAEPREARVAGEQLRFGLTDADGHLRQWR